MTEEKQLFASALYPNFPFENRSWIAIAFDRDRYDNTRLPQPFFDALHEEFSSDNGSITIWPEPVAGADDDKTLVKVKFEWNSYSRFMLNSKNYSPSYKIWGESGDWAFWSDTSISAWGGAAERMARVFESNGGISRIRDIMFEEFSVRKHKNWEEMRSYISALLGSGNI